VHLVIAPLVTGLGAHATESGFRTSTVTLAVPFDNPIAAVIATDPAVAAEGADALNVPDNRPAATVIFAGTVNPDTRLLAKETVVPPSGAGTTMFTVHTVLAPATMVGAAQLTLLTDCN
jgi:hypothetical protein